MSERTEHLFLSWFAERYDVGVCEPFVFSAATAYVQGLLDAKGPDDNKYNLHQVLGVLRSAEAMTRALKQYQVKIND